MQFLREINNIRTSNCPIVEVSKEPKIFEKMLNLSSNNCTENISCYFLPPRYTHMQLSEAVQFKIWTKLNKYLLTNAKKKKKWKVLKQTSTQCSLRPGRDLMIDIVYCIFFSQFWKSGLDFLHMCLHGSHIQGVPAKMYFLRCPFSRPFFYLQYSY